MKTYLNVIVFVLFSAISSLAIADAPRVRFDAPQTLAVRDVTSPEFAFVHPEERMIEARIPISLLLERGDASDIREVIHRLESSTSAAQVVDYSPKTQLATQIIGSTNIERQTQQEARLGFEAGATYYGLASGKASGDYQTQSREASRFEQLPALELLSASGTVDRGRGVYFKLKPSPRTTLEGAYVFAIVLRVPRTWRSGLIYLGSEAVGVERGGFPGSAEIATIGRGRFVIAIYQQGDTLAQQASRRYIQAEANLKWIAAQKRGELERRIYPSPLHKLGVTRDGALAKDWLETVLFRSASADLLQQLPSEVRVAVEAFHTARRELGELNQQPRIARASIAG